MVDELGNSLAFANILFKNSTEGTVANAVGQFNLESDNDYQNLVVSFMGYETKEVVLLQKNTSNLTVKLIEDREKLQEVVIISKPKKALSKKENPAYRILKEIWKNKKKNGLKIVKSYEYYKYTSIELGLNSLDSSFLKKALKKEYASIIKILKQDKKQKSFIVPIYLNEKLEVVFGNNITGDKRVDIKAERSSGIAKQGFAMERIGVAFNEIDVYRNNILILDKSFVSPISTNGYGVYHYVLNDSTELRENKQYTIYFFPKQDGDLALEGSFTVENKTFALTNINMRTNRNINLNLVRNLYFEKKFKLLNDSIYLPLEDKYEGDFTLFSKKDKEKGLYIKKSNYFSKYKFNKPKNKTFYNKRTIKTRADQFKKDDRYWEDNVAKDPDIKNSQIIIKGLRNNKKIRNISGLINTVSSGYIDLFWDIQFGPFWTTFGNNDIEGLRIRTGFRNFSSIDDKFRINSYLVCGTKDLKVKYAVETKYLLPYNPRIVIGASYMDDYEQLGLRLLQADDLLPHNYGNVALFFRGENYTLSDVQRISSNINVAFTNNFYIGLSGIYQKTSSIKPRKFSINYRDERASKILTETKDFIANATLVYTPRRNVYGYGVEQKYGKNVFPTSIIKYGKGLKGIAGSQFSYDKLQISHNHPIVLGKLGVLNATVEIGKIFGTVPISLLSPVPANQSYSLVANSFALLDYYDFITDTYLAGHFEYHFDGFLMNRILWIKKLKIRSLFFCRGVSGTVSDKNKAINKSSLDYNTPDKIYFEYGFGFENLGYGNLRPFRVDFIWRTNFLDTNGARSPHFGVLLGIKPGF